MVKRTIEYTDYNGVTRKEDFYFNITKSEALEMEMSTEGGLVEKLKKMVATQNGPQIMRFFKEFILKSYGEKSDDGRRFIKSQELSTAFSQTEAYNILFTELCTDADAAAKFVNGAVGVEAQNNVVSIDKQGNN